MQRKKQDGCRGLQRRERLRSLERLARSKGMTLAQAQRGILELVGGNRYRKTWCSYVFTHHELTPECLPSGLEAVARKLTADDAVDAGFVGSGGSERKGVLA